MRQSLPFAPARFHACFSFAFFASSRFAVVRLCRGLLLFLSPFGFAFSPYLYSQSTGERKPAAPARETDSVYTLRIYEDLVIVDVLVTDKAGKPVRNLRKEHFQVFEDKVSQKISTLDFEDLSHSIQSASSTSASPPIINLSKTELQQLPKEIFQNRRLMVLMLDLSSMPVEDQISAQKAAQDFIEKQMTPADLVAVVSNSSNLKLLQNFTNDREALLKAVRQFMPGESSSLAELGTTDPDAADGRCHSGGSVGGLRGGRNGV